MGGIKTASPLSWFLVKSYTKYLLYMIVRVLMYFFVFFLLVKSWKVIIPRTKKNNGFYRKYGIILPYYGIISHGWHKNSKSSFLVLGKILYKIFVVYDCESSIITFQIYTKEKIQNKYIKYLLLKMNSGGVH